MSTPSWLSRSQLLIGDNGIDLLQKSHVLAVGLGGVGSFAAEFLVRSGIGEITIVDGDTVDPSNRNRQLPALSTTHGQYKTDIMAERLRAINPELKLHIVQDFINPEKAETLLSLNPYDYVMDCIDSITPKLLVLQTAYSKKIPIVSSMGAGGKMDPTQLRIGELYDTYSCVFAQCVRKRLKKLEVGKGIKAVFSSEINDKDSLLLTDGSNFKRSAYGTVSYLPAAFGGLVASVVIRDLLNVPYELHKRPPGISKKKPTKKKKPKTS
jgi:tRNA A37 threonylcarbamoyladenosine dehydratase